jgi:hypothetical protein
VIRTADPYSVVNAIVNPLVYPGGSVTGYISSRLMAAYDIDDHTIHVAVHDVVDGRLVWHYELEHDGANVFQGFDLTTPVSFTYADAAKAAVGHLTMGPGDTDTPAQAAWREEHAETLSFFSFDEG